jgi:hypothetical protein
MLLQEGGKGRADFGDHRWFICRTNDRDLSIVHIERPAVATTARGNSFMSAPCLEPIWISRRLGLLHGIRYSQFRLSPT